MPSEDRGITLSFVFPCLNEEETLKFCIDELTAALTGVSFTYERIVADNGSSDRSREIAAEAGARVVLVTKRGYGTALRGGFAAAQGEYIAFADADGSYPVKDIVRLFDAAKSSGADMVIGSRLDGDIEPGAMPFLHRRLGTPVLTSLINLLYQGHLSDCNSGFRLMRKSAYESWHVRSDGMEFVGELLIKALKRNAKIIEIPSGLRKDRRSRPPHLRTWRDGMRNLLFILSEKPALFELSGLTLCTMATILQVIAYFSGPINFLGADIFDIHSRIIFLAFSSIGLQVYLFSCHLYVASGETGQPITRWLIDMDEAKVFFRLLILLAIEAAGFLVLLLYWGSHNFTDISLSRPLMLMTHLLLIGGFIGFGVLGIHILKKRID